METAELILSMVGTEHDGSDVVQPSDQQVHALRKITQAAVNAAVIAREGGNIAANDYRGFILVHSVARRLCGPQEDGYLPPLSALIDLSYNERFAALVESFLSKTNRTKGAEQIEHPAFTTTPAQLAAAWEKKWQADPDRTVLESELAPRRQQRILHAGLTRQKLLARDENGRTLVHEIARRGCIARFAGLLNPADLTIMDNAGRTPLSEYEWSPAYIPPAFWQPEWMDLPVQFGMEVTVSDLLIADYRFYVEENFDLFHPGVKALLLAGLIAK